MRRKLLNYITIITLTLLLAAYIINPVQVLAAPSIALGRSSGPVGGAVTVSGAGFAASEAGVTVLYDGTALVTGITADAAGNWSAAFAVPSSASGAHIVDAAGPTTTAASVPDQTFTVTPNLSMSRTSGPVGSSVSVTGSGFGNGETGVTVTFDGQPVGSSTAANSSGAWSVAFSVPAAASGSHLIRAYGSATAAGTTPDITFSVQPTVFLSRTTGAPGISVNVTGAGFGANETGITITYDGTAVGSTATATSTGAWTASFVVPASAAGAHTIRVYGSMTTSGVVPDMSFSVGSGITINRANGLVGTAVTVTGSGFAASETGVTVTYDGTPVGSTTTANATGAWTITFAIPASAGGTHTIRAYGSITAAGAVQDVTFTLLPSISINKTSGTVGTSVTVTGGGFGAGETGITVIFDSSPVSSNIAANATGDWTATFAVPPSAFGSHNIRARGSATQTTGTGESVFSVTPSVSISPTTGYVGATAEISGYGLAANSTLRLLYDDQEIPGEGIGTDANGSFSKRITIPKSIHGAHNIRVIDFQKNESKVVFTIESTPPPVPGLQSPEDGARLGLLGDATPALRWSSVTDPSGVTYILQVDTSPDFSQPVLEKIDLSTNRYTLTTSEALPLGEYYWRVKAIDGASNESAWSEPRLLKSGLMALWALILIIVGGAAVVGTGLYFLVTRLTRVRKEVVVGVGVAEGEVPQVVAGQWRAIESEEAKGSRALPWRLALPEAPKGAKTLSTEDQARLKVIVDFAQSLPLVEPGYNVDWLVDLLQTETGIEFSATATEQLLKGELQVRYEPAWTRHPAYQDLTTLLEGQTVLQDLNAFVDSVNRCASEAVLLLQDVYRDTVSDVPADFLLKGGLGFISSVYSDAMFWFLGKSLRDPSERDYSIKPRDGSGEEAGALWLWVEDVQAFATPVVQVPDEKEGARLRGVHLKLRRKYRASDRSKQVAGMLTQLEVQRSRLLNVFSQFGNIKQ